MSESKERKQAFEIYLSYFPQVEPPVSITSSSIQEISKNNKALPYELLFEFVFPWRDEKDLAEWIPAISLPVENEYHAVLIWELDLLTYNCILATYTSGGSFIDHAVVAQLHVDQLSGVHYKAAVIDEDSLIYTMESEEATQSQSDLDDLQKVIMEILPSGHILKSLN